MTERKTNSVDPNPHNDKVSRPARLNGDDPVSLSVRKTERSPLWVELTAKQPGEIVGLTLLRSIAILMVVVYHFWLAAASIVPPIPAVANNILLNFRGGVTLFFVLSGYLISSALIRQFENTSTLSTGRFYLKRAFRILPAYYAFLIFCGLLAVLAGETIEKNTGLKNVLHDLPFDFLLVSNIWEGIARHGWSLAMEEQFYLILPLLSLITFRFKPTVRMGTLIVIYFVPLIWRLSAFATAESLDDYAYRAYYRPWARFDDLVIGVLLATVQAQGLKPANRRLLLLSSVSILALGFISNPLKQDWTSPFLHNAFNLGFAGLLLYFVTSSFKKIPLFLTLTARLSYSIYLWNILAGGIGASLVLHSLKVGDMVPLPKVLKAFLSAIVWTYLFAVLSFRWIEIPFLRLRERVDAWLSNPHQSTRAGAYTL